MSVDPSQAPQLNDNVTTKFAQDQPDPTAPSTDDPRLAEVQRRLAAALGENNPMGQNPNLVDGTL